MNPKPLLAAALLLTAARAFAAAKHSSDTGPAPAYEEDFEDANVQSAGGIVKFGENIAVMEGEQVDGPVIAVGGSVRVDGAVNGPVVSIGGATELGPHSEVNGAAVSVGGKTVRYPGSRIDGAIVDAPGARFFTGLTAALAYLAALSVSLFLLAKLSASIGWIIMGLALIWLFPSAMRTTKTALERKAGRCVLVGALALPGLLVVTMTLCLSIIGIPLIPLLLAAAAAAYIWGFAALGYSIGTRMVKDHWDSPAVSMLLGMAVLKGLQWLPVVRWVVFVGAAVLGLGASILSRFGGKPSPE